MSTDRPERESHQGRLLRALEQLLALDATELGPALRQAAEQLVGVLGADKINVFVCDPDDDALLAVGMSDTPMGRLELTLGLNRFPMAGGGRAVLAFQRGESFLGRRADQDPEELRPIIDGLGVRSQVVTPWRWRVSVAASCWPARARPTSSTRTIWRSWRRPLTG